MVFVVLDDEIISTCDAAGVGLPLLASAAGLRHLELDPRYLLLYLVNGRSGPEKLGDGGGDEAAAAGAALLVPRDLQVVLVPCDDPPQDAQVEEVERLPYGEGPREQRPEQLVCLFAGGGLVIQRQDCMYASVFV